MGKYLMQKSSNNVRGYFKQVAHNAPSFNCELTRSDFLPKRTVWKGRVGHTSYFTWITGDRHSQADNQGQHQRS